MLLPYSALFAWLVFTRLQHFVREAAAALVCLLHHALDAANLCRSKFITRFQLIDFTKHGRQRITLIAQLLCRISEGGELFARHRRRRHGALKPNGQVYKQAN